jgi:hypothetical protein
LTVITSFLRVCGGEIFKKISIPDIKGLSNLIKSDLFLRIGVYNPAVKKQISANEIF